MHPKVIDCFTFNGEYDLLEIRLNILNDYVDEFIIVEATKTFSGKDKPLYYEQQKDRFSHFASKIRYYVVSDVYSESERRLAETSPNTIGAAHWQTEFLQKESIKKSLTHLNDDDIVYIGDVDEIWDPEMLENLNLKHIEPNEFSYANGTAKIELKVYTYYLNNRSTESFRGTLLGPYKYIKNECLNHLRSNPNASRGGSGWHFTSMGGYEAVKRKLSDSYTRESYWTETVENNLKENVEKSKDFLGRGFTYQVDESEWPTYLKENKEKYKHLCKQ
jgi:beta-1,4-mannosyl-glycoprotein beta-1,4-N-acetylglucosaminyltransferase